MCLRQDRPQHDNSYKLLFSHPQMVEDLLRGFVREELIMAPRVMTYVGLLYLELARRRELSPAGKLT